MPTVMLAIGALAFLAISTSSQTTEEIIGKYIITVGGAGKIQAIKTLRRTGKFTGVGGFETAIMIENKRSNMVRQEFSLHGLTSGNAYDGKSGWKIEDWQGQKDAEPQGEKERKQIVVDSDCDVPQVSGIREVKNKSHVNKQAPAECLEVFRAFFRYVQSTEPNLVTDAMAQNRWLSTLLRKSFGGHIKQSGSPKENPDYPSNQTFIGVWNKPTTFSILGSRHYDYRNADNPYDNRAVIDVLYEWEKTKVSSLDNNYPGERSLHSFVFVHEGGAWKIDDIYTFTDEYASSGSLRGYFETR